MHLQPHIHPHPGRTTYVAAFERWLRRSLTPLERSVIAPIERLRADNRRLRRPTRIYVDDPGHHGTAIRDILILYIRWYATLVAPAHNSCIIARYRTQAHQAIRHSFLNNQLHVNLRLLRQARLTPQRLADYRTSGWLRRLTPNILTASAKYIDHIRGHHFTSALILDAADLGHSTRPDWHGMFHHRRRFQTYRQVHTTTHAILPDTPDSLTIIHGNPNRHPRSLYATMRRTALQSPTLRHTPFHVLTPTPDCPPKANPDKEDEIQPTQSPTHPQTSPTIPNRPTRPQPPVYLPNKAS